MSADPPILQVQEFVRRLKHYLCKQANFQVAWFLGAGCSVTSGIPAAGSLVQEWLRVESGIPAGVDSDARLKDWTTARYPDFTGSYAAIYGKVVENLFPEAPLRQDEIERLTAHAKPDVGYAMLATLLGDKAVGRRCNTVLTTNFDDLAADAIYIYGGQKPRIIAHESLMHFVRSNSARPYLIKLHGDTHLGAKNTEDETRELPPETRDALAQLLRDRAIVFLGYGAGDKSISEAFAGLPAYACNYGVYWVGSGFPGGVFGDWLRSKKAHWVQHRDFDLLMLLVQEVFELPLPYKKPFADMLDRFYESMERLTARVAAAPAAPEEQKALEAALESAVAKATDWWAVELEARKHTQTEPDKADQIYAEGLKKFPDNAPLLGNYALFLEKRGRLDEAEGFYKRALEADPNHANNLGNYAELLEQRGRLDEAEGFYKRALEADPNHANSLGNYAVFLKKRGRLDEAEGFYKRALEADPNHANNLGNYAELLEQRGRLDEAEGFYKRALEADPNHANRLGNYAVLLERRGRLDEAEGFYKRALEADPNHANHLGNYALFLEKRGRLDEAEAHYKRALEADPNHANTLGNYALFLEQRGRLDEAEGFFKRALEVDPKNAINLGNYAEIQLLRGVEEGFAIQDRAEQAWEEMTVDRENYLGALFNRYVFGPDDAARQKALARLCGLLATGLRCTGWNFAAVLKHAQDTGAANMTELQLLADVINDKKPLEALHELGLCGGNAEAPKPAKGRAKKK